MLDGVPLEVDLIEFDMLGFEIILEMDWIFRHFVSIDCRPRTMALCVSGMGDKGFHGSKLRSI